MMDALAAYSWFGQLSVLVSVVAVCWTMVWQNLEHIRLQQFFARNFNRRARRLAAMVDPFLSVTFEEYEGGRIKSSDAFKEVRSYLTTASTRDVRHLRAECGAERDAADKDKLVLSMAKGEEVAVTFRGATVWWSADSTPPPRDAIPWYRASRSERRFFRLEFHESHRDLVLNDYIPHVRREGRAIMVKNRQRRLYTNIHREGFDDGWYEEVWTHVPFDHPKTFDKLAMDPAKKKEIIDDLEMFRNGKKYHNRVGKPWKRGYLLYGPPGTGKSTMVAAIANYLDYDVYDFELTSVKTNTELRKLLIETKSKSIMVFEDIDCSLDLTGKRKSKEEEDKDDDEEKSADPRGASKKDTKSKVTLSGLLNFIDGLWSACGEERLIVFTTNHVEKLDPALIRTGRMDKKIEMSYCDAESFRFLARMHLDEDVEGHELFGVTKALLQEVNMVPVDVGEHLTRKSVDDDAGSCLARLVMALEKAKEEAAKPPEALQAEEDGKGVVVEAKDGN
ncbi:AAA-ATPase ASD, mitochondrial [Dichanthelium oligosanthes]|uniref:AAA-ATPase ASD, mitochondrial n=1 Tax=Dichanthelium oligosanthes TaxID=888268 RepID=A0A1E5W8X3_9POAL|nr:AAA-ATPase ASD, mitochondrial [Dichanthelium oligosanthes]